MLRTCLVQGNCISWPKAIWRQKYAPPLLPPGFILISGNQRSPLVAHLQMGIQQCQVSTGEIQQNIMFSQKHGISLDGQSHTHMVKFDFLSFAGNGRNVWDFYV